MEAHEEIDALRKEAISHLHALLQHAAGRSPQEIAYDITELAFENGNPVKDFFAAVYGTGKPDPRRCSPSGLRKTYARCGAKSVSYIAREPPPSPKGTLKSRSSRSILRFSRSSKSSEGKAPVQGQPVSTSFRCKKCGLAPVAHTVSQKDIHPNGTAATVHSTARTSTKGVPNSSCFSTAPRPVKSFASTQYQCIMCDEYLSSKGVCKRHLEDQHVSPKQYKCEKCAEIFAVKAKCKEHIRDCGKGLFLYVVVKPEEKKTYACAFTGDVFSSMARYVEHLLSLSERSEDRPVADMHRKLYALLARPNLLPHVNEISSRLFASPSAWRNLRWNQQELNKAIDKLEYAVVLEDGTLEFSKHMSEEQRRQQAQPFLGQLLCAGKLRPTSTATIRTSSRGRKDAMSRSSSTSFGSNRTATPKASLNPLPGPPEPAPEMTSGPSVPPTVIPSGFPVESDTNSQDVRSKRHLSDNSRFFVPSRLPPGPPLPPSLPPNIQQMYGMDAKSSGPATPMNVSTTSLPFRQQDAPLMVDPPSLGVVMQPQRHAYTPSLGTTSSSDAHAYTPSLGTTGSSDAASENTLMSSYQEPELVTPMSFDYHMWHPDAIQFSIPHSHGQPPPQHHHHHHHHHHPTQPQHHVTAAGYPMAPDPAYFYPTSTTTTTRTPSVATEHTYVVDYNSTLDQKSLNSFQMDNHGGQQMIGPGSGTFFWDDEEGGL